MCGFKSKIIYDERNDFGDIMALALRYSLGRRTYVPALVVDFIKENISHLSDRIRNVMINDIENYLKDREMGLLVDDKCDADTFMGLLKILKEKATNE